MTTRAIIVSDVHLTCEGSLAYKSTTQLPVLLEIIKDYKDTELVLAGDVFDFLEAGDYAGWEPTKAGDRMQEILNANPGVVKPLKAFAKNSNNRIVLLPGNHDPEVALPNARKKLADAIGISVCDLGKEGEITIKSAQQHEPFYGYSLQCNPTVWVLHGDRYDDHNFIDRAKLLAGPTYLKLPRGSHLVYKVLRRFRQFHPWFYYLDVPEWVRVLLLMLVDPALFLTAMTGHPRLAAELLMNLKKKRLADDQLTGRTLGKSASPPDEPNSSLEEILADCIAQGIDDSIADNGTHQQLNKRELLWEIEQALKASLQRHDPLALPGPDSTLSSSGGIYAVLDRQLQGALRPSRDNITAPHWQDRLSEQDIVSPRLDVLPDSVTTLIAGHTHGPRWIEQGGKRYINSGAWIPIGFLAGPVLPTFWSLRSDVAARAGANPKAWTMEVPATYVEVTNNEDGGMVTLNRLGADGQPVLIQKSRL